MSDRHLLFQGLSVQRKRSGASAVLPLALIWSASSLAQSSPQSSPRPFAADIVVQDAGGALPGAPAKLHAAIHQTRIETAGASHGFFISDTEGGTALFVRSAQHLYMDAGESTPLTQIFVWVDSHDPCRQWRAAATTAGVRNTGEWRCELIERAALGERELLKYRVLTPDRRTSYGWVDPSMGFPVKWQSADGKVFALENIVFEAQPASLFSIPSDYRKLDPQALLERIKHSDVWAEPTK
jgi:hypothetical protein